MATVKVVDGDATPQGASFTSQLLSLNPDFSGSLILASKVMQDGCYSNKAWAKSSGLPPCEIGCCECALGDALEWCLWVGKIPAGSLVIAPASNRAVARSKGDGELFTSSVQNENRNIAGFNTPLPRNLSLEAVIDASSVQFRIWSRPTPAPTIPEVTWGALPWTPVTNSSSPNDSPSTPSHSHSPSSTDSSSGDRTIQTPSATPPPGQFPLLGTYDKAASDLNPAPYAFTVQPPTILNVDRTSGLSFLLCIAGRQRSVRI
jgi:hypothetical protein